MKENKQIFCTRSPRNLHIYYLLEEAENNSPAFKGGLCIVVSFWRGQCKDEKGITLQHTDLTNTVLARWSRLSSTVMSHADSMLPWYEEMGGHFAPVTGLPAQKPEPQSNHLSKYQTNPSWVSFDKIPDPYSSKLSMSSKTRKSRVS